MCTPNTHTPAQLQWARHLVPGAPVAPAFPLASGKATCPLGPLRLGVVQGLWNPSGCLQAALSAAECGKASKGDDPQGPCPSGGPRGI